MPNASEQDIKYENWITNNEKTVRRSEGCNTIFIKYTVFEKLIFLEHVHLL
jgi:hypothetical protein